MELKAILLTVILAAGFWVLHRTWDWLGEARARFPLDGEEADADC